MSGFMDELHSMFDAIVGPRFEDLKVHISTVIVEAIKNADPFLDYEEAGKITGQSPDAFRNWVHRPEQAELLAKFARLGERTPRIRRSTLVAFIEAAK